MNVIFLDFDGVLDTKHYNSYEDIEKRIKLLSEICKENDSKVVIEASSKNAVDEETLEVEEYAEWIKFIFKMFNKYGIECIGRTPNVEKTDSKGSIIDIWKEDEILLYLSRHPEIEHFCVIDDDDQAIYCSDLDKVRDHLVKTIYFSDNPEEEGLLPRHKEEVAKKLSIKRKM